MTDNRISACAPSKPKDESWRHYVAEADLPLFNALRDRRMARCKQDGVPPYVICTNRQLAAMIAARPQSLAQLGEIEDFGKAKLERYGADILAVLSRPRDDAPTPGTDQSTDDEAGRMEGSSASPVV